MNFNKSDESSELQSHFPLANLLESLSHELDLIDLLQPRPTLRLGGVDAGQSLLVTKLKVLATRGIITTEEFTQLSEFATTR